MLRRREIITEEITEKIVEKLKPKSRWAEIVLQSQLLGDRITDRFKALIPSPSEVPMIKETKTYYFEDYPVEGASDHIFALQGSGTLIDFFFKSETNDFYISPTRDRLPIYKTRGPLKFSEWMAMSVGLKLVNSYREYQDGIAGLFFWGCYGITFKSSLKIVLVGAQNLTIDLVAATWTGDVVLKEDVEE